MALLLPVALLLASLFPSGNALAVMHFRVALSSSSPLTDHFQIDFCADEVRFDVPSHLFNSSDKCHFGHAKIDFISAAEKAITLEFAHSLKHHFGVFIKVLRRRKSLSSEQIGDNSEEMLFHCLELVQPSIALSSWQIRNANFSVRRSDADDSSPSKDFSLAIRYRMDCGANFFGPNCDIRCELSDWQRRIGHFECDSQHGQKRCVRGWTGTNCDRIEMAPLNDSSSHLPCLCVNGGKCSPNGTYCICPPGLNGKHCEKCVTNNRCRGFCHLPGGCACPEGKGGQFCEKDLEFCARHSPCQNGATCLNNPEGSFTCECPSGFGGRNCERRLTACGERPCRNGARCVPQLVLNSVIGFRCECPPGFFGQFCQVRVRVGCADLPCQNGGSCADSFTLASSSSPSPFRHRRVPSFLCICANGWAGQICDQPWENCRVNSCQNGASCLIDPKSSFGFVCRCSHGWRGILCGEREDDCKTMKCQNGGICLDGGPNELRRCICRKGFSGEQCEKRLEQVEEAVPDDGRTHKQRCRSRECLPPPRLSSPGHSDAVVSSVSMPILLLLFLLFAFLFSLSTAFSSLLNSQRLSPLPSSASSSSATALSASSSSASASSAVPHISTVSQHTQFKNKGSSAFPTLSNGVNFEDTRYVCEPNYRIGPESRRHLEERVMSAMGGRRPTRKLDDLSRVEPSESNPYEEISECCQHL